MGRLVGYGVSQVPTNGMLGGMAYQDPVNVSVNILRVGTPGGNFQPGNGNNASLALSGIFTGSYTPSGSLGSLYAKATVLGIANDAGVTENNSALIGFSCLNNSGYYSQAYFGAVSSPGADGDLGRGAVLVWGRRSGNNYTESMRISRTGNVGIGTTSPTETLQVVGNIEVSNSGWSILRVRSTAGNSSLVDFSNENTTSSSNPQWLVGQKFNEKGPLSFWRFTSTGGVGGHQSNTISLYPNDDVFVRSQLGIGITNPLGTLQVGAAGTNVFVVTSTGSVGIGTTNPRALVQIGAATTQSVFITSAGFIGLSSVTPRSSLDLSQEPDAIALPQGTTAQRPTGTAPYIRYNTTNSALEFYNGTDWVEIISDYFPSGSVILG